MLLLRYKIYMVDKLVKNIAYLAVAALLLVAAFATEAAAASRAYVIPVDREIGTTSWRIMKKGMEQAMVGQSDVVVLHINTYGGAVDAADSMRTCILNCPVPVVAFIDNTAASAGALISIACDSIYMRPGSSIGAATVVDGNGNVLPDKYQSFMRSMMRATAESHGKKVVIRSDGDTVEVWRRNPLTAEAMVDARTVVPGVDEDSTRVLSFTAEEAIAHGYCEGKAGSVEEVVRMRLGMGDGCQIDEYRPTAMDSVMGFLSNPAFQAILIMFIIGGIYFELQQPGLGLPTVVALLAAALYFAPLYIEGLAAGWEILAFFAGLLLILLEIFVIPGFGITGILGIVLTFGSLVMALLGNDALDFEMITTDSVMDAILIVLVGLLLGIAVVIYVSHKIGSKGIMKQSALDKEQRLEDGYIGVPTEPARYVGHCGEAYTVLRPGGKVRIDDDMLDAVSTGGFIEAGTRVRVVKYENAQLYVEPCENM